MRAPTAMALVVCACAGPTLRGAEAVFPGTEPVGTVVAEYPFVACRDAAGRRVSAGPTRVTVLRDHEELRLVELREAYESLVYTNWFEEEGAVVFQAVVQSESGTPWLRQYRIPADFDAATLEVADRFSTESSGDGFVADIGRVALSCTLSRLADRE